MTGRSLEIETGASHDKRFRQRGVSKTLSKGAPSARFSGHTGVEGGVRTGSKQRHRGNVKSNNDIRFVLECPVSVPGWMTTACGSDTACRRLHCHSYRLWRCSIIEFRVLFHHGHEQRFTGSHVQLRQGLAERLNGRSRRGLGHSKQMPRLGHG